MKSGTARGMLLALAAAVLSGVAVFVNSYGVKHFSDATVYTTAKNGVAGLVLLLFVAPFGLSRARRPVRVTRPTSRGQLGGLIALAIIGGSSAFVLFFEGLARIESGPVQAQFINKTLVVWVAVLAVVVLHERIGVLQLLAVGALVVGQIMLSGGFTAISHMAFGSGEWMILAATLLWAIEVVIAKILLRSLTSWTVALTRMVGGSVLLIGWVLLRGHGSGLIDMTAEQWRWVLATGALLAAYVATWLAALALAPAAGVTAVLVAAVPVTEVLQVTVKHAAVRPDLPGLAVLSAGALLAFFVVTLRDQTGRHAPR